MEQVVKKDYKKARIEVEGRTFELEFWMDSIYGIDLPYVSASEIVEKTLPTTWFRKQPQIKEECVGINYGWTDTEDRVKLGLKWVYNYLQKEKEQAEYQDNLSKFLEKYGVN